MSVWKQIPVADGALTGAGHHSSRRQFIAWLVLGLLLATNVPLHVCMPLASDAVLYDLQARVLLDGGVLYRDVFETNLPGIVWIHAAVRSVVGWSSAALRMVDLAVFAGVVWLFGSMLRRTGLAAGGRVGVACLLSWCYLSVSEWCHCQRDTWMLLPALAALQARIRQSDRMSVGTSRARVLFAWGIVEGLLWAVAFWIKPFVAVPALACFFWTAWCARDARRIAADGAGLLCGGIAAGAAGVLWLYTSSAWPHFLETFLEWNPDYVAGGRARWTADRLYGIGYRLFPWVLLHLAAVPVAIVAIREGLRRFLAGQPQSNRTAQTHAPQPHAARGVQHQATTLLAVFYLAWFAQTLLLQQPFDYIQVPPILLAIGVLATVGSPMWLRPNPRLALVSFVVIAALASPTLKSDRLAAWWTCLTRGSTPGIRDQLAYLRTPDYTALAPVERFLSSRGIRDQELTCYHVHLIHLYPQLGVRPSTRYVGLEALRRLFPKHVAEIDRTVMASRQRYVVTDLVEAGLSVSASQHVNAAAPNELPPAFPQELRREFPWNLPIVFRSGRYLVHAVPPAER